MFSLRTSALLAAASALATLFTIPVQAQDLFASQVVSVTGTFNNSLYRDPLSLLGKPTTYVKDAFPAPGGTVNGSVAASMVFAAYNTAPDNSKLITTINNNEQITVKFDTPIVHDPNHWYGQDFIVYGNSFFVGSGFVYGGTDMGAYRITEGGIFAEPLLVSVSPDNINWFTYTSGPYADDYFPTNPFAWDRANSTWGAELDWTKPVDPALTAANFAGLAVADAIDLYNGSAGGTSFSLAGTGFDSISYIRISGVTGFSGGEVDGISRVGFSSNITPATAPEPGTLSLFLFAGAGFTGIIVRRRLTQRSGKA
jgi:hypothetical protein